MQIQALRSPHHFIKRDYGLVPLYRHGLVVDYALVDLEDLPRVIPFKWLLHKEGYAYRRERRSEKPEGRLNVVYMQRDILGLKPGDPMVGDHKDGNTLDNRKRNLAKIPKGKNSFGIIQRERRALDGVQPIPV